MYAKGQGQGMVSIERAIKQSSENRQAETITVKRQTFPYGFREFISTFI